METNVPRAEALHINHQWFTELQPPPDGAKPWIRILQLKAGAFGDPIHGCLAVEGLDATEPFDALSYCCGPPMLSRTITINSTPGFRITQNLWNALQRVRKADGDRRIWIDAVCIDQDDEREKSSQVRHMHAVYSRAEEVCIYWGECAEQKPRKSEFRPRYECSLESLERQEEFSRKRLHEIMSGVLWGSSYIPRETPASNQYLARCKSTKDIPCGLLAGCAPTVCWCFTVEFAVALEEELLCDVKCDASSRQFWWKRLWTVQELLLAKHPVVYCGPYVMLWRTVCQVWTLRHKCLPGIDSASNSQRVNSELHMGITYLDKLLGGSEPSLHALLWATIDKAFTEPKDRILALLGALPKGTMSLDYSMDVRVIYTLAATHCIATQGTFDILFSQWGRSYQLDSEANRLHSCVPGFGQSKGFSTGAVRPDWDTSSHTSWEKSPLKLPEQGRWEGTRISTLPYPFASQPWELKPFESISVLNGRDIGVDVIENTALRSRIAFNGAHVATVSKVYCLGQHEFEWILDDLSRSKSRYFAEASCGDDRHWHVLHRSCGRRQEEHAYDLYALLLESCALHRDRVAPAELPDEFEFKFFPLDDYAPESPFSLDRDYTVHPPVSFTFESQRQLEKPWATESIHDPKECLELIAAADQCLRRYWKESLPSPPPDNYLRNQTGKVHSVFQTVLSAVLEHKTWSGAFFLTSDGHLGIGPEATQPGDQIVVLDGARSPFVLGPLKKSSDYGLVGDSFVLGLMHGEVRDLYARGKLHSSKIVIQ
jgi:hypothetical protein